MAKFPKAVSASEREKSGLRSLILTAPVDFTKSEEGYERYADGLTPEIVRTISAKKDEPEWMLQFRLSALETYHTREHGIQLGSVHYRS